MVILVGKIRRGYVRDSEVYFVGFLNANIITSDNVAVLIGSGKVGLLVSNTCILTTLRKPLVINTAYCGSALLIGSKSPIAVGYVKAGKVYARRIYAQKLEAREAVLGELCIIDEVDVTERTTFIDPYMYIKKAVSLGRVDYAYKVLEY
ncbi:MAG: hypothetical protein QXG15_02510 [Desulfurococcaceae archaeon]